MIDWHDLLSAAALCLVIEGLLPFISPATSRRAADRFKELPDQKIRIIGAGAMMAGVVLLYFVQ